jgi:hypothetical protein
VSVITREVRTRAASLDATVFALIPSKAMSKSWTVALLAAAAVIPMCTDTLAKAVELVDAF